MTTNVSTDELDFVQIDRKLIERAVEALECAKRAGLRVVTAESCTGGLIAAVLSERPAPQNISTAVLSPTRLSKNARLSSLTQNLLSNSALSALRSRMQWRARHWNARKPISP
jgi:nicotinamide-nucleotide amidase